MASEKFTTLIETLRARTHGGRASWSPGSRDDTYIWSGSSGSVTLLTKDNDGISPWIIRILDGDGRVVDEEVVSGDDNAELYGVVQDLYDAARADALDITGTINGLLDDLG